MFANIVIFSLFTINVPLLFQLITLWLEFFRTEIERKFVQLWLASFWWQILCSLTSAGSLLAAEGHQTLFSKCQWWTYNSAKLHPTTFMSSFFLFCSLCPTFLHFCLKFFMWFSPFVSMILAHFLTSSFPNPFLLCPTSPFSLVTISSFSPLALAVSRCWFWNNVGSLRSSSSRWMKSAPGMCTFSTTAACASTTP